MAEVTIYTDGAARGNPNGPGGYGALLRYKDDSGKVFEREYSAGYAVTTNNRMELMAAIVALEKLRVACRVTLYSDSKYLTDAYNEGWIYYWKEHGYRNKSGDPVKNAELWARLCEQTDRHEVTFVWIKGHAGHPENERCDELATSAADGESLLLDDGGDLRTEIPAPKDAVSGGKKTAGAGAEPLLPVVDEGFLAQALEGKLSTQKLETLLLQLQNRIDMEIEISEKLEEILERE